MWYDDRDEGTNRGEIYYSKFDNNGNVLINNKRITDSPTVAVHLDFAIDSNDNIKF